MSMPSDCFEIGSLFPEELDAWYAFCGRIFESADEAYFRAHFENDPDARCEDIFVARREGEIVSSVRLFTRSVFVSGRAARVGGIGEVCTDPSARGLGLSSHLLVMAMNAMDARGWELGMLYGVLQSHYGRQGFADAPARYKCIRASALAPLVGKEQEVRPFREEDLNVVMGLYDLYSSQFDLTYRREKRAYWEKWVLHEWKNPCVLVRNGQIAAYADTSAARGKLRVREAGALPGEDDALGMLLGECARICACETVVLPVPVLPHIVGEADARVNLMVRMQRPALGFASRKELLKSVGNNIVQWDTDDY